MSRYGSMPFCAGLVPAMMRKKKGKRMRMHGKEGEGEKEREGERCGRLAEAGGAIGQSSALRDLGYKGSISEPFFNLKIRK